MAKPKRTWLDGPAIPADNDDPRAPGKWPGEKLGMPQSGAGSLGSVMRRAGGVAIDWAIAWFIVIIASNFIDPFVDIATTTYLLFGFIGIVTGWLFARTPGQAMLGMGIARIDEGGARVGLWRAAVRTLLTMFIFPAAMVDSDGRGLHDKLTKTAVIRG